MLVRLIILTALGYLGYRLYKKFTQAGANNLSDSNPTNMKRCAKCGLHLPEPETLKHEGKHFCCLEHKQAFLNDRLSDDHADQ